MTKVTEAIMQEEFIIDTLHTENAACKGCQDKAIEYHTSLKYHLSVLKRLCDYIQNHYLWELEDDDILWSEINEIAKEEWPKDEH